MGWSEDNPTEGADSPILKKKCTSIFVPEKNSSQNSYTSMVKDKKKKEKIPSLRYGSLFSLISLIIVIFWLAYLTLKVEEKSMVTDLELAEVTKARIMAEDEARAMQKIIEHYAQDGNLTGVDMDREARAAGLDDCGRCFDECGCDDNLCEKVCDDGQCDSQCKADFNTCCEPEKSPETDANVIDEDLDEKRLQTILSENLSRSAKHRIKKIAKPVGLDAEEYKYLNILTKCIEKGLLPNDSFVINGACDVNLDSASLNSAVIAHGCDVQWISLFNRAEFYKTCLEKFDTDRFFREVRHQIGNLNQIKRNIIKYSEDFSNAEITGGSLMTGGGLVVGLGLVIPPLAPFTSVAGAMLALSGTGTSLVGTLLGASWTKKEAEEAQKQMAEVEEDYNDVVQMMALFLKSAKAVDKVRKEKVALEDLQKVMVTAYINAIPGAIAGPQLMHKVGKFLYKKFGGKIASKLTQFSFKTFSISTPVSTFITKISSKVVVEQSSKLVVKQFLKNSLSAVGKTIVPGINIAAGIYSIIIGADKTNVHQGLLYEVEKNIRELQYNSDEIIDTYNDLGLNKSTTTSLKEVTWMNIHKTSGNNGLKLQLKSIDTDGTERSCSTDFIGRGYQGWESTEDFKQLDECSRWDIFNSTVSIRILEGDGTIDKVQIGTNGYLLPCTSCEGKTITASSERPSDWMQCKQKIGMKKFKTHTSNKKYAGTDNSLYFHFEIDTNDGKKKKCKTGNLNTDGLSKGETKMYYPDDNSFGTCNDAELGDALYNRDKDKEEERTGNIRLTVQSDGYWYHDDDWHVDLIKAYFITVDDKEMVLTCQICNNYDQNGTGGCFHGFGITVNAKKKITFTCTVLEPENIERSLQSFQVKVCDLSDAGSDTDQLKLKICKKTCEHNETDCCCTTNLFGKDFKRGQWSNKFDGSTLNDDGGEILGQCEGFLVEESTLDLLWENENTDAVCISDYKFFGGGKAGITSTADIPFIQCKGRQVNDGTRRETSKQAVHGSVCQHWSDSASLWSGHYGYCEGWSDWAAWQSVISECSFLNSTLTVKTIAMKVCDDEKAGSKANIQAVIQNIDGERCTTTLKTEAFKPNGYVEISDIGEECQRLEIKGGKAEAWIVNADEEDNLCLTDVYFDVSSSNGETDMLKCRLNDKDKKNFKINVIDKEVFGLPMICR